MKRGKNPEDGASHVMRNWILKKGIDLQDGRYRIFGYSAPDSDPGRKNMVMKYA